MSEWHYYAPGTSNRPHLTGRREHRCWCEPVTAYVSQATGNRVVVHRATDGSAPPAWVIAKSRRLADMPDQDAPEDWL